jgi:hypothetical protein
MEILRDLPQPERFVEPLFCIGRVGRVKVDLYFPAFPQCSCGVAAGIIRARLPGPVDVPPVGCFEAGREGNKP